ncbi:hypothetical protein M9H77_07769 [Catharanthus roseus]|uniref:Uncharacterized protein n=1 Tax=Catharanthus roseus TaxID=4058 RepID=A0ACC0BVV4_CATRO|nr:hypothetical protein M9H77_07769 [Catharanthus roseus]
MMMRFHENSSSKLRSLSESGHISIASTPKFKETCNAIVRLHGQSPYPKTRSSEPSSGISYQNQQKNIRALNYQTTTLPYHWSKQATDSWGTYQVCPWTNLSFKPLLALRKSAVPSQSMMWCPRKPIGPLPPRSTPLFKWIHSSESETSMPSEEALIRETSHVQ